VVTIEDVRSLALSLPRTTVMGFAFPREEREWLVGTEPEKFLMPTQSDLRYNWVLVRLAAIEVAEMRELVFDAWRMVVPKRVAAAHPHPQPDFSQVAVVVRPAWAAAWGCESPVG